jgi:perosamine synthetase
MIDSSKHLCEIFISALNKVLGVPKDFYALHEPEFIGKEWEYIKECLDTGWVSSAGKYVDEFEKRVAEYTGAKYAIAVVNGTAAQHISLLLVGVRPGDEVLVPALSFVATANAVAHCGATPHFVDSSYSTLGMDPEALLDHLKFVSEQTTDGLRNKVSGKRIAAIVPMHTFGHPVDLERLLDVARRYRLMIVEDAAESLGSTYQGRHTGLFGSLGIISFNGNKVITTGGGGVIVSNDAQLSARAKHLSTTAKLPHSWEFIHDEVGYNYRMPNLNAALGCAQMEKLPDLLMRKRKLAASYSTVFNNIDNIHFHDEPKGCRSNYWLNAIRLENSCSQLRDALLRAANNAGYQCRPAWKLLSELPMYANCPRAELVVAKDLEASLINVPSSPKLAVL